MSLALEPNLPWGLLAAALAAAAGGLSLWSGLGGKPTRGAIGLLAAGAASAWALAALNPLWVRGSGGGFHLVLAADVSQSVLRAEGGWPEVRRRAAGLIQARVAELPRSIRSAATFDLLTFRDSASSAAGGSPLDELAPRLRRLRPADFAPGEGSDLEAGLRAAGEAMREAGRPGAVVLLSDGNQTRGDALAAARRLARQGVPVHVLGVESRAPALAIAAADLPDRVEAGATTYLRGLLEHFQGGAVRGTLSIRRNPGIGEQHAGRPLSRRAAVAAARRTRLRQPLEFQGVGVQFVELELTAADRSTSHLRRLFTHVDRPVRVLSVGGDQRWTAAFPAGRLSIARRTPEEIPKGFDWSRYDTAALSAVTGDRFREGDLAALAEAVQSGGLGLFFINGGHQGSDPEAASVLMSYVGTPLGPLLPVDPGPRPHSEDEPPRHVVIVIDSSGSMGGGKIYTAKQIASHIIVNLLDEDDVLDLIIFTSGARFLVSNLRMREGAKEQALELVNAIRASGATDPEQALKLLADRQMEQCGLIFISDGQFEKVAVRPDCRATVFAIGESSVPADSPLRELADPIPVGAGFDPGSVSIPYFDKEPSNRYFEPGRFTPRTIEGESYGLPAPEIPLQGSAVSRRREETRVITLRPKLADPVLAYRAWGEGMAGMFASGFPPAWLGSERGREAIAAWISRTVAYTARDRYDFQVADRGDSLHLRIALASPDGSIPAVEGLSARLETSGQAARPVALRRESSAPGTFSGTIPNPPGSPARPAALALSETGPDALPRPQRIPFMLPASAPVSEAPGEEASTYGINRALLGAIRDAGRGVSLEEPSRPLLSSPPQDPAATPLWPWLSALGAACFLASVTLQRWRT